MTENDRRSIMVLADTIQGEINRMCVTSSLAEFNTMHQHAQKNFDILTKKIYTVKFILKSESERCE